jgi:tetratricopeptide (TPR) repeat protein
MTKLLVCLSILIAAILLFISIINDHTAQKYYSEYKRILREDRQDIKHQIHYLRKSLEYSPSNAKTLFELGRSYIREKSMASSKEDINKSYELAKETFQEALMRKPTDGSNYAQYAWYIGYSGETNEAIEYFEKAISLEMTDAYVHRQYAMWCVNQVKKEINFMDMSQFVDTYKSEQRKAEILKSYDTRFINGVSIITFLEKAQTEWDKALSLGTYRNQRVRNRERAHNSLAELNLMRYEIDGAIGNYKRANNKIMLAKCYFIKEKYTATIGVLEPIIKEGGEHFQGNSNEIKRLLMEIINHNPKDYMAFYWLGETYTRLGKNEEAIVNLKRVVELNPEHVDAHLNLAKLYKSAGKSELAIYEYEMVLSLNSNHKEAADLLGEAIIEKYKDAEFMIK